MADMIPRLREMAESPHYALRRGVLLVSAQHLEELQGKLAAAENENKRLRDALENIGLLTTHFPGEQYRITLDEDSVDAINAITTQALKEADHD